VQSADDGRGTAVEVVGGLNTSMRRARLPVQLAPVALIILLWAIIGVPEVTVAAELKCAGHSLNRDDQSRLTAVARAALPRSVRLSISGMCWNPQNAYAWLETRRSVTAQGDQQWWELSCEREELEWQCDPAKSKQLIKLPLAIDNQLHDLELSLDKDTTPERARVLAARALDTYTDPASRLPGCEIAGPKDRGLVDVHRGRELPSDGKPIHVSLSRDGLIETVFLDDVSVAIEFPGNSDNATTPQASCWNDIVVVS
jgi:hypothetical protein